MILSDLLRDNLVAAGFGLFVLLMVIWGYRKGLMIKLLTFGSVLAAFAAELLLYPHIMEFLNSREAMRQIYARLGQGMLEGVANSLIPEEIPGTGLSAGTVFNSSPLYSFLGLDTLAESAGQRVGQIAAGIICFILIFIVIRIGVRVLIAFARGIRKIRAVRWIDGVGGALFGAAESIVYIWILMLLVSAFPGGRAARLILEGIGRQEILMYLYNHNLVLLFFAGMLGAAG